MQSSYKGNWGFHLTPDFQELFKNLSEEVRIRDCSPSFKKKNLPLTPSPPMCRKQSTTTNPWRNDSTSLSKTGKRQDIKLPPPPAPYWEQCWVLYTSGLFTLTTVREARPILPLRELRFNILTLETPSICPSY